MARFQLLLDWITRMFIIRKTKQYLACCPDAAGPDELQRMMVGAESSIRARGQYLLLMARMSAFCTFTFKHKKGNK